jgi:hypothetical protein
MKDLFFEKIRVHLRSSASDIKVFAFDEPVHPRLLRFSVPHS